jgi:predicted Zn-dependent protease
MLLLAWFVLLSQNLFAQNQAVGDYIGRICHRLSPNTEVLLVNDTEVKASALSGGSIEISTALLARLQNEAELAGVLAHEVAHLAAKTDCVRFVITSRERSRDQEHEREADEAAIRTLTKAGYDPVAMLDFFSKYRHERTDLPMTFSARDLLIERLQIEATDHPLKDPIRNTPEFDSIHSLLK